MTTRKKKKEPPYPPRPVLLLQSVNFTSLFPSGLDRSGVFSPCSALDCPSLRSYSIFVKLQWLLRTFRVSRLKPSPTFVDVSIAHFGSGIVALDSPSGAVRVDDAFNFRYGIQMRLRLWDRLCPCSSIGKPPAWKRGSYFPTEHLLPQWQPHTVSPPFCLLVFRSEHQVCLLPLSSFPLRGICCHEVFLIESCLKPTMKQIESRFYLGIVLFCLRWMLLEIGYFQAKICWILGQLCDVMPVVLRIEALLGLRSSTLCAFSRLAGCGLTPLHIDLSLCSGSVGCSLSQYSGLNSINLCFALKLALDVIAPCRAFWGGLFGFYYWPLNVCCPCVGVVSWLVLLVALESVRCFGCLWQFTILVSTFSCIVRSLVAGLGRWVSISVICINSINLLDLLVKVVWPFCFRLSLGSNFGFVQGTTVLIKCWFYFTSTQHVKSTCGLGVYCSSLWYPLQFPICDGCILFLDDLAALICLIVWLSWVLSMVVVPVYPWLVWVWSWLYCHIWAGWRLWMQHTHLCWSPRGFGSTTIFVNLILIRLYIYMLASLGSRLSQVCFSSCPTAFCAGQHIFMLRLYLWLLGKPPYGGWLHPYLIRLLCSLSAACFASFLVPRQCPLGFVDAISETSYFVLRTLTNDTFRFGRHFDAGIRISHCLHDQWPECTLEAYDSLWNTQQLDGSGSFNAYFSFTNVLFSYDCIGTKKMYTG